MSIQRLLWTAVLVLFTTLSAYNLVATLAANSHSYSDETTLPALNIRGNPPQNMKYGIESFNGAGASERKEKEVNCP